MTYRGVARGRIIELEGNVALPDGTRVSVILEQAGASIALGAWLTGARQLRAQLPITGDSVEILRKLREERASR